MTVRELGFVLAFACGPALASPPGWEIHLVTSGGFTGGGVGGFSVRSDGTAELLGRRASATSASDSAACRTRISPPELAALTEAVRLAEPRTWRERYVSPSNPHGCCDMLGWRLTLQRTGPETSDRGETFWFDDGLAEFPRDLAALRTELQALWNLARQKCEAR